MTRHHFSFRCLLMRVTLLQIINFVHVSGEHIRATKSMDSAYV